MNEREKIDREEEKEERGKEKWREGYEMWEINSGEGDKIGERGDSERMKKKGKIGRKYFTREEEQIKRGRKRRLSTRD